MSVPPSLRHALVVATFAGALFPGHPGGGQDLRDDLYKHMRMTPPRALQPGDPSRADAVVAGARRVMEQYADYRKALANGYAIFLPGVKQRVYHFTRNADYHANLVHFDPEKPTSLLYIKLPSPGPRYKLVGLMYAAPYDASEDELDRRIPLSIAHWHLHHDICLPPAGQKAELQGSGALFGLRGSIVTADACTAAGGTFRPHIIGWVVHVYAAETDPSKIWNPSMEIDDPPTMPPDPMDGMPM
jgi:hypothetical protein